MTNYQAVNRQSSKGLTSVSCVRIPSTSRCPFGCLLKELVAANLLSTLTVPEVMGQFLLKVIFCHSRGGGWVVCDDNNQLVIPVWQVCVCVCQEHRFAYRQYEHVPTHILGGQNCQLSISQLTCWHNLYGEVILDNSMCPPRGYIFKKINLGMLAFDWLKGRGAIRRLMIPANVVFTARHRGGES